MATTFDITRDFYIWDRAIVEEVLLEKYRYKILSDEDNALYVKHTWRQYFIPRLFGTAACLHILKYGLKRLYTGAYITLCCTAAIVNNNSISQCNQIKHRYLGLQSKSDILLWRVDKDG